MKGTASKGSVFVEIKRIFSRNFLWTNFRHRRYVEKCQDASASWFFFPFLTPRSSISLLIFYFVEEVSSKHTGTSCIVRLNASWRMWRGALTSENAREAKGRETLDARNLLAQSASSAMLCTQCVSTVALFSAENEERDFFAEISRQENRKNEI